MFNTDRLHPPPTPVIHDARIMEALLQVSLAINAELDVSEVLNKVVYWARKLVECSDASILIWDARKEIFLRGASTDKSDVSIRVRRNGGSTRWIVDNGQPLVIPNIIYDPHTPNPMLIEERMQSYAGVPIIHGNQAIAVLYALSQEQRNFDQGEMEVLSMLASMAAVSIANAQLVESRQLLHDQRKMLMRLVAHDLLNPITNIQGFFNLLMDDLAPPSASHQEWIRAVERSLDRMQELIREIIRYEKMADGELLIRERVDLAAISRAVVRDVKLSADAKQLTILSPPPEQKIEVMGDAILLREVVYNLLSNAIKYTPPGGTIDLRLNARSAEILLSVSDSGVGIAPEDQASVFEIFHRVGDKSKTEGSGLGLHLIKAIVKRHGGDIVLESRPGQGSTFFVHLPAPQDTGKPATVAPSITLVAPIGN